MKKTNIPQSILLFVLFISSCSASLAQTTITLQPDAVTGKDAILDSYAPSATHASHPELNSAAWTNGGVSDNQRSLLQFDLSSIPPGAVLLNATLNLYNNPNSTNGQLNGQHFGPNASVLQRVTAPWQESTVTWNNQPSTTNVNEAGVAASTNPNQDYAINVTQLFQDILANPVLNYGIMLKQQTETPYRCLLFASSNHPNAALHPMLQITYTTSCINVGNLVMQPGPAVAKDAILDSYAPAATLGNHPELNSAAWTNGGITDNQRSLLEFDISSIPAGAVLLNATLNLYNNPTSTNGHLDGQHFGPNTSVLQRVTAPWQENTVTWNNQPPTTNVNEAIVPASTSPNQDYAINVTQLFQDILANPALNYGIMLKQQTETPYRCFLFASSDNADNTKWPKLTINYYLPLAAAITPGGNVSVCAGSATTLTATAGTGYTYKWYRNNVLLGTTTQTFTTGTGGTYKCIVTSGSCTKTSNSVVVTQINNPTPAITASGPLTFCTGQSVTLTANTFAGVTYQWQKNSVNIPGATGQSYVATATGSYRANETKSGCSKFTPKKSVKVINCTRLGEQISDEATTDESDRATMEVFPNPFIKTLTIEIKSVITEQTEIRVMDVLGKVQYKQMITTNQTTELSPSLPTGLYIINAIVNGEIKTVKVVKTK